MFGKYIRLQHQEKKSLQLSYRGGVRPMERIFSNGYITKIIQRKLLKFSSVEGLWTKIVHFKFYKTQLMFYMFCFSLKIFQFRSVGPTPVGPSEPPTGTDGTIPCNK